MNILVVYKEQNAEDNSYGKRDFDNNVQHHCSKRNNKRKRAETQSSMDSACDNPSYTVSYSIFLV